MLQVGTFTWLTVGTFPINYRLNYKNIINAQLQLKKPQKIINLYQNIISATQI